MVYLVGVQNRNNGQYRATFGKEAEEKKSACSHKDVLMYDEKKKRPITTALKINGTKLVDAFTTYPKKGLKGSKNANFYEFLTMGTVPYLAGSATMIAVFNAAAKFFDTPAAKNAAKLGKKMGLGVAFYGIAKTLSKKFIETPVALKYDIDVNLPYKKEINELPEKDNTDNLVAHEYHKAYESVDFPRWDLFYDNKSFGPNRNSYYEKVGKRMGIHTDDLDHADQKVKPLIREKIVKTKLYSTLSSYFWAATGVGIAMQKPWEKLQFGKGFIKDFGKKFAQSCNEFVNNSNPKVKLAGRALLGTAVGLTLLGNFSTLNDFNKNKGVSAQGSTSLIDESKEKVVC